MPNRITGPFLHPPPPPSTGLPRRPFHTGGTCPCISSLIHEGGSGGRDGGVTQAAPVPTRGYLSIVKSMTHCN